MADDNQDIRDGIEIYLKNEGYQVLKAANGMEALERLTEQEVHVIIQDMYDTGSRWSGGIRH